MTRGWRQRCYIIIIAESLRKRLNIVLLCFYLLLLLLFLFYVFACMPCVHACMLCFLAWCACVHDVDAWDTVWILSEKSFAAALLCFQLSFGSEDQTQVIEFVQQSPGPAESSQWSLKRHVHRGLPGMRWLTLWRQGENTTDRGIVTVRAWGRNEVGTFWEQNECLESCVV